VHDTHRFSCAWHFIVFVSVWKCIDSVRRWHCNRSTGLRRARGADSYHRPIRLHGCAPVRVHGCPHNPFTFALFHLPLRTDVLNQQMLPTHTAQHQ
jgi:hypothetical protein